MIIIAAMLLTAQTTPELKFGSWTVKSSIDPMTDKRSVTAQVKNEDGTAIFAYGCDASDNKPETNFRYVVGEFLGSSRGRRTITREFYIRVDDKPMREMQWWYGDSGGMTNSADDVILVSAYLGDATKLMIRAVTYRGANVDVAFNVTGYNDARRYVNKECGLGSQ